MSQGSDTYDSRISHTLDPSSVFGGSVGGAGTDENVMDNGVADTVRNHKRQHDDDDKDDPSAGPNQGKKTKRRRIKESESSMKPSTTKETSKGKAPSKSSKTGKSATTKKLIEEPIIEVVMDDLKTNENEDVVNDADRPQDDVTPKTNKPSRDTWFKQPPRPPTPDPKWNYLRQVVVIWSTLNSLV
ncbi:hypothetical protein Tco_1465207 [Tanacetum coccineum]